MDGADPIKQAGKDAPLIQDYLNSKLGSEGFGALSVETLALGGFPLYRITCFDGCRRKFRDLTTEIFRRLSVPESGLEFYVLSNQGRRPVGEPFVKAVPPFTLLVDGSGVGSPRVATRITELRGNPCAQFG